MASGIYAIVNTVNGKTYIGSSVDIDRRWKEHLKLLRKGKHFNKHLQKAFDTYGEPAFESLMLQAHDGPDLLEVESRWIRETKATHPDYGYNFTDQTDAGMRGRKHTQATKQKISEAQTGNQSCLGREMSQDTRRKISEAHKGMTYSDETKRKVSLARKGSPMSDETKRKISEAQTKHQSCIREQKNSGIGGNLELSE